MLFGWHERKIAVKFKSTALAILIFSAQTLSWAGLAAGFAAYADSDYATALKEFLPAAEKGNARAQVKLGQMFRGGHGVPQDAAQAEKWLRLAVDQGNPIAQYEMGRDLVNGIGDRDSEGLKLLRSSAGQNNINAMELLGFLSQVGRGVPMDRAEAVKWYSKAAARGSWTAQSSLDTINAQPGIERGLANFRDSNYSAAMVELEPFAERGDPRAQHAVGVMYDVGDPWIRQDKSKACKWFQLAASQNNPDAQFQFAYCFDKDPEKKLRLLRLSAAQGNVAAMIWLGRAYEVGRYGVTTDLSQAMDWYIKAASTGEVSQQYAVGDMYAQGKIAPLNLEEAAKWYAMAAHKGFPMALSKMGDLYAKGLGVPKDRALAIEWYLKAIDSDSIDAQRGLADLLGE